MPIANRKVYIVEDPDGQHHTLEKEPLEGWEAWSKGLKGGWKVMHYTLEQVVVYK